MKRMRIQILFVVLALCGLCFSEPASSWRLEPGDGDAVQTTVRQPGGVPEQPPAELQDRAPRGGGLQIIPLILIIPLGWLFFRSMNRRNEDRFDSSDDAGQGGRDRYSQEEDPENLREAYRRARAQWEWMEGAESSASGKSSSSPVAENAGPSGFNADEFLRGAKLAYTRLTEAFDELDADAAAPFASRAIVDGLRARAASGGTPTRTEIVLVEAELLEHTTDADKEEAVVLYDALVRRGADAPEPEQVRQVWRFRRNPGDPSSTWRLERMEPYSEPTS
jgi:predicted lipid-binding transport protein (Tim44 family)